LQYLAVAVVVGNTVKSHRHVRHCRAVDRHTEPMKLGKFGSAYAITDVLECRDYCTAHIFNTWLLSVRVQHSSPLQGTLYRQEEQIQPTRARKANTMISNNGKQAQKREAGYTRHQMTW
jgi:hypothetical protein